MTNKAAFWNDCERESCGQGTMAVTRGFETPMAPWAGVVWRRCSECGATTVQHLPREERTDRPPVRRESSMYGQGPASYGITDQDGVITIQATGAETLRITGVNELLLAAHNLVKIYQHEGDLTYAMSYLEEARKKLCFHVEGRG